jgi:PTS system nitrogen regulatory IIA component
MIRCDAGFSLSELARRIGVSTAYLSRVEHGHDAVPSPDRVHAIAQALEIPPLVLLEIAQGAGAALSSYLARVPAASTLFLEMARREFGTAEIARIKAFIDDQLAERGGTAKPVRLGDLLTPRRVLVQVICDDLDDIVTLAATRLASERDQARVLAARILEREGATPSLMGGGVVVPHAILAGSTPAAALLTLARPMRIRTPDAKPLRVAVVIVTPTSGRAHVQLLAHIARLAVRDLVGVLADAKTPERALARLEALDVS